MFLLYFINVPQYVDSDLRLRSRIIHIYTLINVLLYLIYLHMGIYVPDHDRGRSVGISA